MPVNDGGSAFPTHLEDAFILTPNGSMCPASDYGWQPKPGMSLLDHFAGRALEALLHPESRNAALSVAITKNRPVEQLIAFTAYEYAAAMLDEKHRREQLP